MLSSFNDLCKKEIDGKRLNLLYRATRDGFGADAFHAKCDNRSPTITIIQTTDGYVFGGYTQASWTSSYTYCYDKNAYLFSLANPINQPFVSKVTNPVTAICCHLSLGPTFGYKNGKYDIFIGHNSNLGDCNHSDCFTCYQAPDTFCPSLTLNRNFKVKDIEVFEITKQMLKKSEYK